MEPLGAFGGCRLAIGAGVVRVALSRDAARVHSILSGAVSVSCKVESLKITMAWSSVSMFDVNFSGRPKLRR